MATFFKDYLYYFIWSPFTIWASRNDANTGKCLIILPRFENKHLWYKVRRIWQTYIYVAAAAAVKSLQSCPTLCNPIDGSPPGSTISGIFQARTWSGLPFPSPMHESEKGKWNRSVMSDSSRPHGLQPTRLLHPWDFPGRSAELGCHRLLRHNSLVL